VFLADADCLPQTLAVLRTRAEPLGIELVVAPRDGGAIARSRRRAVRRAAAVPRRSGEIRDLARR
jgi:glycine dehydrogenase